MPGYTYPGTDTLKNKLGAASHDELEEREAEYVAGRRIEIEAGRGPPPQFDTDDLKAIIGTCFRMSMNGPVGRSHAR